MANLTNEKFMEELERDYPGFDWDSFNIESYPDVYQIHGMHKPGYHYEMGDTREEDRWVYDPESAKDGTPFVVGVKFATEEEANFCIEKWKKLEHVCPDSFRIQKTKSDEALEMEFNKICREGILAGKNVFPMHLP